MITKKQYLELIRDIQLAIRETNTKCYLDTRTSIDPIDVRREDPYVRRASVRDEEIWLSNKKHIEFKSVISNKLSVLRKKFYLVRPL